MRLVAQARGGFFPAPPEAVAAAARWLQPPAKGRFCILDPCCGKGDAILQLAEALGCKLADTYAVELDEMRAEHVNARLRDELGCQVAAPCSYFGTWISGSSFSFIWCNPPFDDELGGGKRVELTFLERSTNLLVPGGVIALVCPSDVADNWKVQSFLLSWYTDLRTIEFPSEHRRFKEVVIFGVKREAQVPQWGICWTEENDGQPGSAYQLPKSNGPLRFVKTEMTDKEVVEALKRSPLRRHLEVADEPPLPSPPMSPGKGHRAILLAAGHLDGRVCPDDEPPHVVRGTVAKKSKVQSVETEERDDGVSTKTIITEQIVLTVRAVWPSGEIRTLTQDSDDSEADSQDSSSSDSS